MIKNTPEAFIDYIQNNPFDYSGLRLWEIETLSHYLDPKKLADILAAGESDEPI